ncbi:hypothetical protein A3K72_01475 [Candidatus Woesearchaeota archaeon RBG_13_36_6]|nr:MAG: hypothetical protein A3K72_01475 [Candidatus Woesearchaeota archaeon RBG_13_36_6]
MIIDTYKREKEKKSRKKWIILFIILIFVIYVILKFIKIPITSEAAISGKVPYETEQLSQQPKLTKAQQCYMQEFNWDYAWQGWADLNSDEISPIFWIINYEDMAGSFDIRFAFIDNTAYPYDQFRGRGYNEFKDELSEDAIATHSEWITITLAPRENQTITIPTKAPNPDHAYWALADVNNPLPYEVCTSDTTEEDLTQEKNVTKYKNVTEKKVVKESISLWDWLVGRIL